MRVSSVVKLFLSWVSSLLFSAAARKDMKFNQDFVSREHSGNLKRKLYFRHGKHELKNPLWCPLSAPLLLPPLTPPSFVFQNLSFFRPTALGKGWVVSVTSDYPTGTRQKPSFFLFISRQLLAPWCRDKRGEAGNRRRTLFLITMIRAWYGPTFDVDQTNKVFLRIETRKCLPTPSLG